MQFHWCRKTLGYLIVAYFLYRYCIITRVSYTINANVPLIVFIIISCLFLYYSNQILNIIKQLLNKRSVKKYRIVKLIIEYLYIKPLCSIRESLYKRELIKYLSNSWAGVLEFTIQTRASVYIVTFLMLITPQALIALSLLGDVILLAQIFVLYKILWVILITISFNIIVAFAELHANTELVRFRNYPLNDPNVIYYKNILDSISAIEFAKRSKYFLYIKLIIYLIFLFSWGLYLKIVFLAYFALFLVYIKQFLLFLFIIIII